MKVGTKSVLFGVHCFWWHPITVALSFRRVHDRWPNWWESIGIACHDLGYWGKTDMDGPSGTRHPEAGARLAAGVVSWFNLGYSWDVFTFCLYHSSTYARLHDSKPSDLYLPDKVSLLFDPKWFYLLRARLSGELAEYMSRNPKQDWYNWYRTSVLIKLKIHEYERTRKNLQ